MAATDKTRETRLRRMADRQGLRLVKSRRRDPHAIDYGGFMLVDIHTNTVVAGTGAIGRPHWSLDDVERWLTRPKAEYFIDIDIPEPEEIGRAAYAPDLAYPLAHVIVAGERHGTPWPWFKVRADQDGSVRDLTGAEHTAFNTALEQALNDLRGDRGEAH